MFLQSPDGTRRGAVVLLALLVLGALAAVAGVGPAAGSAARSAVDRLPRAATPATGTYVVQGAPGNAVDVRIDGKTVELAVAAKAVLGPYQLTAGNHRVEFSTNAWKVATTVTAGGSQDVVLHWPADAIDKPVVTVYENDLAPVGTDKGRLVVAHTAVVPPADIVADGKTLFTNIANGEFVQADVPATTYQVSVVPSGGGRALLGPLDLPVQGSALTRVFAIGAPRNNSMDAVVQVIPLATTGGQAARADTGSAGLVRPDGSVDLGRYRALSLLGLLGSR
jgi:hypothetical protein